MPPREWKDQLIPNIVDHLAKVDPDALYAEYPVSTLTYDEGYRRVTISDFANAVNCVAFWLHDTLGPPAKNLEVLAYIGPNDLRYPALVLGAAKAGYVIFLTSPRNSVRAQLNLLDLLSCNTILSPTPRPPQTTAILEGDDKLRVFEVPSVDDLLNKKHPHFPFEKSFSEARQEPLFVVHTSGSTGFPKPIPYTHDGAAKSINMMSLDPPAGFESLHRMYQKKRVFLTFPPFHGVYFACHLFNAVPHGSVIISPISGSIPSAEGLVNGLKKTPADIAFIVPSIVHELSQSPELLQYCAENLETIIYCGGDLPQAIGDIVASKIKLVNQFGATELGLTNLILPRDGGDRTDWKYVQFHPATGIDLRHLINDTYELYVVRSSAQSEHQPTFAVFPDLQEYTSRDLFMRHPSKSKPNLWKWHARADDIIVFLTGEKTNPISMEQHIMARNPEVQAALVMGAQRFQASLLIDPVNGDVGLSPAERAVFIEKIWPSIEEANKDCPAHAKIAKTHILFTHPKKRMLLAGKGTVQRAGTLELYKKELDALYADADSMAAKEDEDIPANINLKNPAAISAFLTTTLSSTTSWLNVDNDQDFFTLGMDSLQALTVVRKLRRGLGLPEFALSTVYANPSISQLTNAIVKLSENKELKDDQGKTGLARHSILQEFQQQIDSISSSSDSKDIKNDGEIAVLTGSTGTLGTHILQSLLLNPRITHIYCLNRVATNKRRLQDIRSLPVLVAGISEARVTFLTTDLSAPLLGLPPQEYSNLLEATLIIHNAWPVNFNLSLPSFRPSIQGLINLIALTASTARAKFFFVSSISSVMAYQTPSHSTPERVIFPAADIDVPIPAPNGYAESKYLSELLLSYAATKFSSSSQGYQQHQFLIARVGQIAGAVRQKGVWNKNEWFPSLVLSSMHIGAIPSTLGGSTLGRIDWVPVDLLADILVELALSDNEAKTGSKTKTNADGDNVRVFHPLNPKTSTWSEIVQDLITNISSLSGKNIDIVPLDIWIKKVKQDMEVNARSGMVLKDGELERILERNPAVKLLEFYEGLLQDGSGQGGLEEGNLLETEETRMVSGRLRDLEGVKREWVKKWLEEWVGV